MFYENRFSQKSNCHINPKFSIFSRKHFGLPFRKKKKRSQRRKNEIKNKGKRRVHSCAREDISREKGISSLTFRDVTSQQNFFFQKKEKLFTHLGSLGDNR